MVFLSKECEAYLDNLTIALFDTTSSKNKYFGFYSQAEIYVNRLREIASTKVYTASKKVAPPKYCKKYGSSLKYFYYKHNKQTTWYFYFLEQNDNYIIQHITNNHQSVRGI